MYAPHVVTLFNVIQDTDPETFEEVEQSYVTILTGVFLDAVKAVNVRTSGLEGADSVSLFIPFSVTAIDAETMLEKSYVGPQEFWALSDEERRKHWTLSIEGNGGETFFVKGSPIVRLATEDYDAIGSSDGFLVGAVTTEDYLSVKRARAVDESYTVTKVDIKDFGHASMRHWEVGGA